MLGSAAGMCYAGRCLVSNATPFDGRRDIGTYSVVMLFFWGGGGSGDTGIGIRVTGLAAFARTRPLVRR